MTEIVAAVTAIVIAAGWALRPKPQPIPLPVRDEGDRRAPRRG